MTTGPAPGGLRATPALIAAAVGVAAVVGASSIVHPALPLAAVVAVALGLAMALRPETATLVVVLLLWLNVPALGVKEYDVPRMAGAIFPMLLALPVAVRLAVGERAVVDRPLMLLLALLGVQLVATAFSEHTGEALDNTITFAIEGIVIYALVINSIDGIAVARRALWLVLGASAFMSAIAIFQAVTGSWLDSMGGFGQVNGSYLRNPEGEARAAGPLGDPNYFAQILLPAVAIAFVAFRRDRANLRLAAAVLGWIVIVGILLTGSRGASLALLWMLVTMVVLKYARLRWLVALALVAPLLAIAVPSYQERVASISSAVTGATAEKGSDNQADIATQGRVGEMKAAAHVFADHPFVGVGPGVFPLYYQEYGQKLGIETHNRALSADNEGELPPRQAHSLPMALAADLGLAGVIVFAWLCVVALWAIGRARRTGNPLVSDAAGALLLGLGAYLVASILLTLAFERYLWLLLALGGAVVRLSRTERTA